MSEKEPKLETHEDAIQFVKDVFHNLGGTVVEAPPRRRRYTPHNRIDLDDYMMDFENTVLQDWDAHKGIPTGTRRFENAECAESIKRNVYPHHSDVDWFEYLEWVSAGGGDEWFIEE